MRLLGGGLVPALSLAVFLGGDVKEGNMRILAEPLTQTWEDTENPDGTEPGTTEETDGLNADETGSDDYEIDMEDMNEDEGDLILDKEATLDEPEASQKSGFYTEDIEIELTLPESMQGKGKILYTTDCSTPLADGSNEKAVEYTEPISVTAVSSSSQYAKPRVIRAIAVDDEGNYSNVATFTYFCGTNMDQEQTLPVISLVTDSDNLYDSETGLFKHTGESGIDWERPAAFSFFSTDGTEQVNMDIGIRLHGGASRDFNLKSFRLYARSDYDEQNYFEYDFFSDSIIPALESNSTRDVITSFKHLILRNGGNEGSSWDTTMMRDAVIQSLMTDTSLDLQAYCPTVVYLNGSFYGIMNLRERYDRYYLASHYNCDKDDVVIYGFWYEGKDIRFTVADGAEEEKDYIEDFYEFVRENDLSEAENYQYVADRLDIENYIDYICVEVFSGNVDWPANNTRVWRYTADAQKAYGLDGKLRFMLYDTDFGLGLYGRSSSEDYLGNALKVGSSEWPNNEDSTLLLRKLLENDEFKAQFESRYMDLLNSNFSYDFVSNRLDEAAEKIKPYFEEHKSKYWSDSLSNNVNTCKNFAHYRGSAAFKEMQNHQGLGDKYTITVGISDVEGLASVDVNSITGIDSESVYVDGDTFTGQYAVNVPVTVTAYALDGYEFVGWEVERSSEEAEAIEAAAITNADGSLQLDGEALAVEEKETLTIVPVFEKLPEETETESVTEAESETVSAEENSEQTAKNGNTATVILCVVAAVSALGLGLLAIFAGKKK